MRNFCLCALLLLGMSRAGTGSAQIPNSVAALHLGMSAEQVKSATGPGFTERLRQGGGMPGEAYPSVLVKNINQQYTPGSNNEVYSLLYVDDKIIFIQHINNWSHDAPNFAQTQADIFEKFGAPNTIVGPGGFQWNFSDEGQPVPRERCSYDGISTGVTSALATSVPRGAKQGCGLVAAAGLVHGNNDSPLLALLSISLLDERALYRAIMQSQKRVSQQRQTEVDKSKRTRAPM